MKLRRSLVEGLDGLLCRICRLLPGLGLADIRPAAAVDNAELRTVRNLDAAIRCHGFFSGADLLCIQALAERAGDAKGIADQASDSPDK